MRNRLLKCIIPALFFMALALCAAAAEAGLSVSVSEASVRPGEAVVIVVNAPENGACTLTLRKPEGFPVIPVVQDRPVQAGYNAMYWNGTSSGYAVPEGRWILTAEMGDARAETELSVGKTIPALIRAELMKTEVTAGMRVPVSYCASEAAELRITLRSEGGEEAGFTFAAEMGDGEVSFPAAVAGGVWQVSVRLGDGEETALSPLRVREPAVAFTPVTGSPDAGADRTMNGWTVPMDITDEAAVWEALTAPVTVLDDGREKAQVRQLVVRAEPRADSDGVGTVTLVSQGVHVLSRGEEWSRIECYASSFNDSAVVNWNALIQGYVPTRYLKEIVPNQQMGIVVDKLTQRLYVFRDGALYSTLLVSTGLANENQPYNETRSGEYLLVSRVGGFYSDNMYCPQAIRFNAGDLLHEVPYIESTSGKDYSATEPKLGTRASHGCVRVQRRRNPEGVNMQWIWNHYRKNTKILIWEDWQGRQIPIPAEDTVLYRNPRKNDYYHRAPACEGMGTRNPEEITYAELSGESGKKLRACPYCGPAPRLEKLTEINTLHAEGGDHDPVLTEARKDCPRKTKGK